MNIPILTNLFDRIPIDIIGALSLTDRKYRYILDFCYDAILLRREDKESVFEALLPLFNTFGLPRKIISDRSSNPHQR